MKKSKLLALLLAASMSAFTVVGCSQNGNEKIDNGDSSNITDIVDNETTDNSINDNDEQISFDNSGEDKQPTDIDNEQSSTNITENLGFADVGEKYFAVVKPVYDAAQTILNDLIEREKITYPDEFFNPRIIYISFCNGSFAKVDSDLTIYYQYDLFVGNFGVKSDYIVQIQDINLKDFGKTSSGKCDEIYADYKNLLTAERIYEKSEKYEEVILPLAEKVAKSFLEQYEAYKDEIEIEVLSRSKAIILKANSEASELHSKLINKINDTLLKIDDDYLLEGNEHFPLLTDQDIEIGVGNKFFSIVIYFQNFKYNFYWLPFNEDGKFSEEYIAYMYGQPAPGYGWADKLISDCYNPTNEEFLEFFEKLDILNMKLPTWSWKQTPTSGKNYFSALDGAIHFYNY